MTKDEFVKALNEQGYPKRNHKKVRPSCCYWCTSVLGEKNSKTRVVIMVKEKNQEERKQLCSTKCLEKFVEYKHCNLERVL